MKPQTRQNRTLTLDRRESKQQELFERSEKAKQWIESILKETLAKDLHQALQDGVVLCRVINTIKPNLIKKWHANSNLKLKALDNIQYFLNAAETLGIAKSELFLPLDLYEKKNFMRVLRCIHSLAILAEKDGFGAQGFIDSRRNQATTANKHQNNEQEPEPESLSSLSSSSSDFDLTESPSVEEASAQESPDNKEEESNTEIIAEPSSSTDQITIQAEPQREELQVEEVQQTEEPQLAKESLPETPAELVIEPIKETSQETETVPEEPKESVQEEKHAEAVDHTEDHKEEQPVQQGSFKEEGKEKDNEEPIVEEEQKELQRQIGEVKNQIAEQQVAREQLEKMLSEMRSQVKAAKEKLRHNNIPFEDPSILKASLETKTPDRKWAKKFYVLDTENKTFFYYNAAGDASPAGEVSLVNTIVYGHVEKKGQEKPLHFNIRTYFRDFLIRASSKEEKEVWVRAIKSCVTKDDSKPKSGSTRSGSFFGTVGATVGPM